MFAFPAGRVYLTLDSPGMAFPLNAPHTTIQPPVFTLNLCLVHHKVLVVPATFKLFTETAVEAHVLVLQLMEGEERSREAAVASISSQDSQRFLLKCRSGIIHRQSTHIHKLYNTWINTSPHPLRAHVHTLVNRHVLDDGTERKGCGDIVWPVETAF